jgi:hypothetical protein
MAKTRSSSRVLVPVRKAVWGGIKSFSIEEASFHLHSHLFQQRQDVQREQREVLRRDDPTRTRRQILRDLESAEDIDSGVDKGIACVTQIRAERSVNSHFAEKANDALLISRVHHLRETLRDGQADRVDSDAPLGFAAGVEQRRLETNRFHVRQALLVGDLHAEA